MTFFLHSLTRNTSPSALNLEVNSPLKKSCLPVGLSNSSFCRTNLLCIKRTMQNHASEHFLPIEISTSQKERFVSKKGTAMTSTHVPPCCSYSNSSEPLRADTNHAFLVSISPPLGTDRITRKPKKVIFKLSLHFQNIKYTLSICT